MKHLIKKIKQKLSKILNKVNIAKYEYGTAGNTKRVARRHIIKKNVQFLLWKAGEQGHKIDYWTDFDNSWWDTFELVTNINQKVD